MGMRWLELPNIRHFTHRLWFQAILTSSALLYRFCLQICTYSVFTRLRQSMAPLRLFLALLVVISSTLIFRPVYLLCIHQMNFRVVVGKNWKRVWMQLLWLQWNRNVISIESILQLKVGGMQFAATKINSINRNANVVLWKFRRKVEHCTTPKHVYESKKRTFVLFLLKRSVYFVFFFLLLLSLLAISDACVWAYVFVFVACPSHSFINNTASCIFVEKQRVCVCVSVRACVVNIVVGA